MLLSPARYDEWLRRASTGDADAVDTEIGRLLEGAGPPLEAGLPGAAQDAAARARAHYLSVVAKVRTGRAHDAGTAAESVLEPARGSGSVGLVAVALSARAGPVAGSQGLARGLDLFQQAERLLAGTPGESLDDPDWVAALLDMWATAAAMGLRRRAVEIGRLCHGLAAGAASPFERYAIALNLAHDTLWSALRPVRRPPYEPDEVLLRQAQDLAAEAARTASQPLPPDVRPQVWQAIYDAFSGDPATAVPVLAELLSEGPQRCPSSLEPALCAARLRALRRLGRGDEADAVRADEAGLVETLVHLSGPPESLLTYLWERALCARPGLVDPSSEEGRLALLHDRQAREHDQIVQSLLELNLTHLELEVRHDALADMTRMDELTGVLNRRGVQPHLDRSAADRNGRAWALLLVDVDGFQTVNDSVGHAAADEMLRTLGLALRRASRAEDVVARIGGDEFLVLADMTPEEPALAATVGDRILNTLRRLDESGMLRASVGVAVRTTPVDPGEWLRLADRAMDDAKRAGGDRVAEAVAV